jgi:hypothetical protein
VLQLQHFDSFGSAVPESPKNAAVAAGFSLPREEPMLLIFVTNGQIAVQHEAL